MNENFIYLDNNATTPLDARVLEAMKPYFKNLYSNPASTHYFGQSILRAVEKAKEQIADLINAKPQNIIITSGATEAINLGIKGLALSPYNRKKHIVTISTEHKAVLDTCKFLESIGFQVSYLPVESSGLINSQQLRQTITDNTLMVAVMYVNNETGVINDIELINDISHEFGALFFCDTTQAVGKISLDIQKLDVDMLACSAHKFFGPKGTGALFINNKRINAGHLQPLIHGGGQEHGNRSGTLNVPGIIGFGKACELVSMEMKMNSFTIKDNRDKLENELLRYPGAFINGNNKQRLYNTTNICFPGLDANSFIAKNKNLAVSNGSACTSAIDEPSHVLKAMGLTDRNAFDSIRFSLSRFNTIDQIETVIKYLIPLTIRVD